MGVNVGARGTVRYHEQAKMGERRDNLKTLTSGETDWVIGRHGVNMGAVFENWV